MGLIVDIVPNHMAAAAKNAWWMDVLEHGPESVYASYLISIGIRVLSKAKSCFPS